jgi:multidrug resistance efflux pump
MQLSLDKLKLEKENYENTISAAQSEITELENQKAQASSSQQLSYTLQINTRQADIREAEYNMALKEKEIATMEADMENADITSPISGRVMSVTDEDSIDYSSDHSDGCQLLSGGGSDQ